MQPNLKHQSQTVSLEKHVVLFSVIMCLSESYVVAVVCSF